MHSVRLVTSLVALGLAGTPSPAADIKLKTFLTGPDGESKSYNLTFYDAACDGPAECEVAGLSCDQYGMAKVAFGEMEPAELAQWFSAGANPGHITDGKEKLSLNVNQISFSEMYGAWEVEASAGAISEPVWKNFGSAKSLKMTVGKKLVTLPVTADYGKFIEGCGKW